MLFDDPINKDPEAILGFRVLVLLSLYRHQPALALCSFL